MMNQQNLDLRNHLYSAMYAGKLNVAVKGQPSPLFVSIDEVDGALVIECTMPKTKLDTAQRELFDLAAV